MIKNKKSKNTMPKLLFYNNLATVAAAAEL